MDWLLDIWDAIVDGFEYVISFEWIGDLGEFFGSLFENMGEFSPWGILFSVLGVGFTYLTRFVNINGSGLGMIESMTQFMQPLNRILWTVGTYVAIAIAGYIIGSYMENS